MTCSLLTEYISAISSADVAREDRAAAFVRLKHHICRKPDRFGITVAWTPDTRDQATRETELLPTPAATSASTAPAIASVATRREVAEPPIQIWAEPQAAKPFQLTLAENFIRSGDMERAEAELRTLLRTDSRNIRGRKMLAEVLFRLGKVREAVREMEIGCGREPDAVALYNLGGLYVEAGRISDAKAVFTQLRAKNRDVAAKLETLIVSRVSRRSGGNS